MASKFESSVQEASDIIYDYPCTSCEENDLNVEAFSFCGQCVKLYCDECAKAHSQLFKKHKLIGCEDKSQWGSVKKDVRGQMCKLHPSNAIQVYCHDHDVVCCTVCVSVKHRLCRSVDHILDVAKGIYKDANYKALPANVTKIQTNLYNKQERKRKNRKALQESCKGVVAFVKELRMRVNKLMDQLEKSTVEEMDRLLATFDAALESDIDTCTRIHDELKQFLDKLQDKGMKSETDGYICYKECQQKVSEAEEILTSMTDEEYEIKFQTDLQTEQYLSSLQTLGHFAISPALQTMPPAADKTGSHTTALQTNIPPADKTGYQTPNLQTNPPAAGKTGYQTPTLQTTPPAAGKTDHPSPAIQTNPAVPSKTSEVYTVQCIQKYCVCPIRALCQLPNGNLVVVDYLKDIVRQLEGLYAVIAQCQLPPTPLDICAIDNMQVAVVICAGASEGIQFLKARNGRLELAKKIKLQCSVSGIAYHYGKLYVSSDTVFHIYTLAGQLEKKIHVALSGYGLLSKFAIAENGSRIYAIIANNYQLLTLDKNGNHINTQSFPDVKYPFSVCVASNGTLFICGSDTVIQVGSEGEKKLATVVKKGDAYSPVSLTFNRTTSQLIVGKVCSTTGLLVLTLK